MAKKTIKFEVEFELPEGATSADCRAYIENALRAERGLRDHDGDPMAHLDRDSIAVTRRAT